MFDIGFLELVLIGIVALLVMGPERLPGLIRTSMHWISKLRSSFQQIKADVEREIGVDEIRQQIHNDSIMQRLEKNKQELENSLQQTADALKPDLDKLQYDISDIVEPKNTKAGSVAPDDTTSSHNTPGSDNDEPVNKS